MEFSSLLTRNGLDEPAALHTKLLEAWLLRDFLEVAFLQEQDQPLVGLQLTLKSDLEDNQLTLALFQTLPSYFL